MNGFVKTFPFTIGDIIAFGALTVSIINIIYTAINSKKQKYILTENLYCRLLEWYRSVIRTMITIMRQCENGVFTENKDQRLELLSRLSALAEEGRFYFPNVLSDGLYGSEKPAAYRGHRHINIECLIHFYRLASENNINVKALEQVERVFTSSMFVILKPRQRNKDHKKYLSMTMRDDVAFPEIVQELEEDLAVLGYTRRKRFRFGSKFSSKA